LLKSDLLAGLEHWNLCLCMLLAACAHDARLSRSELTYVDICLQTPS